MRIGKSLVFFNLPERGSPRRVPGRARGWPLTVQGDDVPGFQSDRAILRVSFLRRFTVNVPGLIIGLAAVTIGVLFPAIVEPEVRWGFRDPGIIFDFTRPFHERELSLAREILWLLCSHQGLFVAGIIMTALSLFGF